MSSYSASTTKKLERSIIMQRLVTVLLSSLAVASVISLITLSSPNPSKFTLPVPPPTLSQQNRSNVSLKENEEECNLFKGRWVRDPNGSPYNGTNCRFIPDWKNCYKYGRRDWNFVNWRWKPEKCQLPRFDPRTFLKIVTGKKMMFVGDSVARNQVESLLCLLPQEIVPEEFYSEGDRGSRTLYFPSHNFTLMFIWATFLVRSEEKAINGSQSTTYNLHLDQVDSKWAEQLPGADYVVISDGHWFFRPSYLYENNTLIGCNYCNEPNITALGSPFALHRAFQTALRFINECESCQGLTTLLRTFAPAHFENGGWDSGGYCNRTGPLDEVEAVLGRDGDRVMGAVQVEEVERLANIGRKRFRVLDVTRAMLARADGHPGSHWDSKWSNYNNDCLHWCLPGPIDAWNDMLLAVLLKEEASNTTVRNDDHVSVFSRRT